MTTVRRPDPTVGGAFAAIVLLAVATASACGDSDSSDQGSDPAAESGEAEPPAAEGIADLVDEVQPSVVTVITDLGEGSGVIYDDDGAIVTNAHVVGDSRTVDVTFADGSHADADVVAADPSIDLAVIRTDRNELRPAEFSDDTPRVGELAVAIGNPLGFENTVSAGIISGLDRSVPGGGTALVGLLQTDAAISPGNSGGALVGPSGDVVGINVAYIPPAGGAVSIGFAIPAPVVVDVADELLADGRVEHPFLGIAWRPLTPQLAEQYGIDSDAGALVVDVVSGSPADDAGVRPSDVIVAIDEEPLSDAGQLLGELRARDPGERVELTLLRGGDEQKVTVELGTAPQEQP